MIEESKLAEWEAKAATALHSAIDEYCPKDEFAALIAEVRRLRPIAERLVAEVAAWEAGALDSDSFDSSMLMLAQDAEKALGKEGK